MCNIVSPNECTVINILINSVPEWRMYLKKWGGGGGKKRITVFLKREREGERVKRIMGKRDLMFCSIFFTFADRVAIESSFG